jgi:hypothetical protein
MRSFVLQTIMILLGMALGFGTVDALMTRRASGDSIHVIKPIIVPMPTEVRR